MNISFSENYFIKTLSLFIFFVFFACFSFCICVFLLIHIFFKKMAIYFKQNTVNSILGSIYITVQYGLKNIVFGAIHSLMRETYANQLIALAIFELLLILVNVILQNKKLFIRKYKIWGNNLFSMIRILIILLFSIDKNCPNKIPVV